MEVAHRKSRSMPDISGAFLAKARHSFSKFVVVFRPGRRFRWDPHLTILPSKVFGCLTRDLHPTGYAPAAEFAKRRQRSAWKAQAKDN